MAGHHMSHEECDWCGSSDPVLRTSFDGATVCAGRQPRIPRTNLCIDCADALTDYMRDRANGDSSVDGELRKFATHECESILEALEANSGLEAVTPSGIRIRNLKGKWMRISGYIDRSCNEVVRDEAKQTLANERKTSLTPASTVVWGDYEDQSIF